MRGGRGGSTARGATLGGCVGLTVAVFVALLLGAGLLLVRRFGDDAVAPPAGPPPRATAPQPGVLLEGAPSAAGTASSARAAGEGSERAAARPPGATHVVRVTLLGLDPSESEAPQIRIRAARANYEIGESVTAAISPASPVDVDVTALFRVGSLLGLPVGVDHPRYLAWAHVIQVPPVEDGPLPRVFPLEVRLVRAGLVTGTVVGPDGGPVEQATVGVFPLDGAKPRAKPTDRHVTRADGRWRLRIAQAGEYLVVATAPGFQPASRRTALALADADLGRVVLARGESVSGIVRMRGVPAAGAEVRLAHRGEGRTLDLHPDVLWTEQGVRTLEAHAVADVAGAYRLGGLSGGAAQAWVERLAGRRMHFAMGDQTQRAVEVPATGVDFDVDGVDLVVEVAAGGRPLAKAFVHVLLEGAVTGETDEAGVFSILMPHGSDAHVDVHADGFERATHVVTLPERGTEHRVAVALQPFRTRPSVALTLTASDGRRVETAAVGFLPLEGSDPWPSDTRDLTATEGRFRFDAPPGTMRLRVRAGGPWFGGTAYWLESETVVQVPETGEVAATAAMREGGRLRIAARGPDGSILSARCTIRGSDGSQVRVAFVDRGMAGLTASSATTRAGVVSSVDPPLEAGTYSVTLEADGHTTKVVDTRIEVAQTTDLAVALEAVR